MTTMAAITELRPALTLELDLGGGPRGASARLELAVDASHPRGVARVAVRGWIGSVAGRRLARALGEWMTRGTERIILDCRDARYLDPRTVDRLARAAACPEGAGAVEIWGLPRRAATDARGVADADSGECGA